MSAVREFPRLGKYLRAARSAKALSQQELAGKCGAGQTTISDIEQGKSLPDLKLLMKLARALDVPYQWFFTGTNTPGKEISDLAVELFHLGVVDLLTAHPVIPGAFRPTEQVVSIALAGNEPESRVLEAIPCVLAWNAMNPKLLQDFADVEDPRAVTRLAWLADVTLTIHRVHGFPGGLSTRRQLEWLTANTPSPTIDDPVGRPALEPAEHPVWRRWKITYASSFENFAHRAQALGKARST